MDMGDRWVISPLAAGAHHPAAAVAERVLEISFQMDADKDCIIGAPPTPFWK